MSNTHDNKLNGKNLKYWRCTQCGQPLGILSEDQTELQIKYKDLFLYVKGGMVRTICRKCGTENRIDDTDTAGVPPKTHA